MPSRNSVRYQAKELGDDSSMRGSKASAAQFDKAIIGTFTKHGVMPGPRGIANAKINQDRGVVCWPFHGTHNEALLMVFDGHGPKGEKASEFCMTNLPQMLETDHAKLIEDPEDCLTRNIKDLDHQFLTGEFKTISQSCGTTSNVLFMRGTDVWVACSGDSRAIKASRVGGKVVAQDLSDDHKPDLPMERKRIEQCGGTVTAAGPNGRPSRVWVNGRIGLAMSRSIGDGECKRCGVIPDPEVKRYRLNPPADAKADGDLFVVVASDGVWEFMPSQEAAELVGKNIANATSACEKLVNEAADRWRKAEGNYRDDITAIVATLPFLYDDMPSSAQPVSDTDVHFDVDATFINDGAPGISKMQSSSVSPKREPAQMPAQDAQTGDDDDDFVKRRLSLTNPYGDDDEDWGDEVADDVSV